MCPSQEDVDNWDLEDSENEMSLLNKRGHFGMMPSSNNGLKKGPWTTAEDEILAEYVKKHGEGNWNSVHKNTRLLRCGKSCRLRWVNHLRPNLKKGAFTAEEEKKIVEFHAKMGNKWAKMAAQLPGRTDNEIKNFWNTRIKKLRRAGLPLYPPELCSQASPESQQSDGSGGENTDDDRHHNFIEAMSPDIPEIKFSGYRAGQELLPCLPEVSNLQCSDIMKSPTCLQYPYVASAIHCTKRVREFSQPLDEHNFSMENVFARAYQTQSSYHDPFSPPYQQHNFPVSSTELKPVAIELPSVQNTEAQTVLCKKPHLSTPTLEPVFVVRSPSVPVGDFPFEQETISDKTGLHRSRHQMLIKNSGIATDLSPVSSIPYGHSFRSKLRKDREVEILEDLNPVSPLDSSISKYHCLSTPGTMKRCLPDDDATCKNIYGNPDAATVDKASYDDGEDDELSSWLDFSAHDSLIDLGWLRQDSGCAEDESTMANDPASSILRLPASGHNDCMMYPLSTGHASSNSWYNMPSICHMPKFR